jgi:hypothetical protein
VEWFFAFPIQAMLFFYGKLQKISGIRSSRCQTVKLCIKTIRGKMLKLFFKAIVEMKICLIFAPH